MESMEYVELQGAKVPKLGIGTWRMEGRECRDAVSTALDLGYRHVDTAQLYGNEAEVGRAIRDSDVDRDDIFLTTKINPVQTGYRKMSRSVERSLGALDTDHVDLLLIHWPNPLADLEDVMDVLNDVRDDGLTDHIGVSNFGVDRLRKARELSDAPVLTDQLQFHPYHPQRDALRYCQQNDVMLTAYSPLGHGGVVRDETLRGIAAKYDKTPAQVALRWATQHRNVVTIPKSTSRDHLRENIDIFDFSLTRDEVDRITNPSKVRTGVAFVRGRLGV